MGRIRKVRKTHGAKKPICKMRIVRSIRGLIVGFKYLGEMWCFAPPSSRLLGRRPPTLPGGDGMEGQST